MRWVLAISLALLVGCENAEEKARYVKEPLETADLTSRASLQEAVTEATTRLLSVRGAQLRADLASDIDATYERAIAQIREREETARQAAEAERRAEEERRRAAIEAFEAQRKREEAEAAAAAARLPAPEPAPAPAPRTEPADRRRDALAEQLERTRDAVIGLEVSVRESLLGDGTRVLVLHNPKPYSANFELRCFTANDTTQKSFALAIPPDAEKRIGFLQGWCGNFIPGQRCEAWVDGELMWKYDVP